MPTSSCSQPRSRAKAGASALPAAAASGLGPSTHCRRRTGRGQSSGPDTLPAARGACGSIRRPRVWPPHAPDLGLSARLHGRRVPVLGQRPASPSHHAIVSVRNIALLSARAARALHEQSVAVQAAQVGEAVVVELGDPAVAGFARVDQPRQALLCDRRLGAVLRRHVVEARVVAHALLVQQVLHFARLRFVLTKRHVAQNEEALHAKGAIGCGVRADPPALPVRSSRERRREEVPWTSRTSSTERPQSCSAAAARRHHGKVLVASAEVRSAALGCGGHEQLAERNFSSGIISITQSRLGPRAIIIPPPPPPAPLPPSPPSPAPRPSPRPAGRAPACREGPSY